MVAVLHEDGGMDEPVTGNQDAAEIIGRIVAEMEDVFRLIGRPAPDGEQAAAVPGPVRPVSRPLDSGFAAA